jgi:hypothetical protein
MDFARNTDNCGQLKIDLQNAEKRLEDRRSDFNKAENKFQYLQNRTKKTGDEWLRAAKELGLAAIVVIVPWGRVFKLARTLTASKKAEGMLEPVQKFDRINVRYQREIKETENALRDMKEAEKNREAQNRVVVGTIKAMRACEEKRK